MSEPLWLNICEPETATTLNGERFCAKRTLANGNPIDDYYLYVEDLLTLGNEQALTESETLGRLLLLGLVSGVEAYFRGVLAGLVKTCPVARSCAGDQLIALGSLDYYGADAVEWGLVDAASLASTSEVKTKTRKLLGFDISNGSSLDAALAEFDKVCHLRHAAIHARGSLGRGNAAALGLTNNEKGQALCVSFIALQQAGLVCHSAVRAYNRFVYEKTLWRLLRQDRLTRTWVIDRPTFKPLFGLFFSKVDAVGSNNAYLAYRSFMATAAK